LAEEINWLGSAAAVLHLVIVLVVSLRVIFQRLYPGTSLAWIVLVATVPYFGLALYVLIGERPLGRRRLRRRRQMRAPLRARLAQLAAPARAAQALIEPRQLML
jgi:cardiolipin synthase